MMALFTENKTAEYHSKVVCHVSVGTQNIFRLMLYFNKCRSCLINNCVKKQITMDKLWAQKFKY